jgi:hypothetical protein
VEQILQISQPKNFRMNEVLIINAAGFIPGLLCGAGWFGPVFVAAGLVAGNPILLAVGLLVSAVLGALLFFVPIWHANPYVCHIVKKATGEQALPGVSYVCQAAFSPRLHGGLRGFLEDADDVGLLRISKEAVSFTGDHVRISLPLEHIQKVSHCNSGWRSLWIGGRRIKLATDAFEGYKSIELIERQSNTIMAAYHISKEIIHGLEGATHVNHAAV